MVEAHASVPRESEIALARRFAEAYRDQYRWTYGLGWYKKTGSHWEQDALDERYEAAKALCREAAEGGLEAHVRRRLCSSSTVRSVLHLARTETEVATPLDAWDRERHVLSTPAGPVDLRTGAPIPVGDRLFRQVTSVPPDAGMAIPLWTRFLRSVWGQEDVIAFVQRLAGYCLTGEVSEQKIFFLHGAGGNGKSVFLDVLQAAMGGYACSLPSVALMAQRHEQHPTILAGLAGRRLAVSAEIEDGARWAEARIKELTGDARLAARFMRGDFFEFSITHKHIIAGNYRPRLRGDDPALARRMVLIPFSRAFQGAQRDPRLLERLRAELPGVLAWAIAGARQWYDGGLRVPAAIADASQAYLEEQDDLAQWIDACCDASQPDVRTPSRALYAAFSAWKLAAGEHPPSERAFSQRLERRYRRVKTRTTRVFVGVRLLAPVPTSPTYATRREVLAPF